MRSRSICALAVITLQCSAIASEPSKFTKGSKVMPKLGATVLVGAEHISYTKFNSPWLIQEEWGDWFWVGDERKGWVQRKDIVAMNDAPAYYAQYIEHEKNNAMAYKLRAVALLEKGELDLAVSDFGEVLRIGPDPVAYHNRGNVWKAKKEYDKAIADYDEVIRLLPNVGVAYASRGAAWALKREFGKAIADYDAAIRLDPARHSAYNGAAWIRATCEDRRFRDGDKAVILATKACVRTGWTNPDDLNTLAAAYAEAGDFDSAVKRQKEAIDLSPESEQFVASARQRLALYQAKTPFRDK